MSLEKKNSVTEIYINVQTFPFKVLRDSSSWTSRNDVVQMLFSEIRQENVWWKVFKVRKVFGCVSGAYYFQS